MFRSSQITKQSSLGRLGRERRAILPPLRRQLTNGQIIIALSTPTEPNTSYPLVVPQEAPQHQPVMAGLMPPLGPTVCFHSSELNILTIAATGSIRASTGVYALRSSQRSSFPEDVVNQCKYVHLAFPNQITLSCCTTGLTILLGYSAVTYYSCINWPGYLQSLKISLLYITREPCRTGGLVPGMRDIKGSVLGRLSYYLVWQLPIALLSFLSFLLYSALLTCFSTSFAPVVQIEGSQSASKQFW